MEGYPIWDEENSDQLYLLKQFESAASKTVEFSCASSGPFELRIDGASVTYGHGATLTERPQWQDVQWCAKYSGVHTLTVRIANRPEISQPWFFCRTISATGIASDTSWTALPAQICASGPDVFDEIHDARNDPRYDDELIRDLDWKPTIAVSAESPSTFWQPNITEEREIAALRVAEIGELTSMSNIPLSIEPLSSSKCVHAEGLLSGGGPRTLVETRTDRSVVIHLDFGRTITGYPTLRMQADHPGGVVDLIFGYEEEEPHTSVRFVSRAGRQTWRGLGLQSARHLWIRLNQFSTGCHLEAVTMACRHVSVTAPTAVETDEIVTKQEVGLHTLAAVRQEIYCLQHPFHPHDWLLALTAFTNDSYLTGYTAAARTMIATSSAMFQSGFDTKMLGFPLFVEAFLLLSGDFDTVSKCRDGLLHVVEGIEQATIETFTSEIEPPIALVALAAMSAQAVGRISQHLGEGKTSQQCDSASTQWCDHVQDAWREDVGLFADSGGVSGRFSAWTNALVMFGALATGEQAAKIPMALRNQSVSPIKSQYQAWYLCEGLWRIGAEQFALDCGVAHWGRIQDRPGETWAEKEVKTDSMYEPGPDHVACAHVLGVKPLEPGFAVTEIRPPRRIATHASGSIPTPRGVLTCAWQRRVDEFEIETEIPNGLCVRFVLNRGNRRQPTIVVNGAMVWRNEKMYPNAFVQQVESGDVDVVVVIAKAGHYHLTLV